MLIWKLCFFLFLIKFDFIFRVNLLINCFLFQNKCFLIHRKNRFPIPRFNLCPILRNIGFLFRGRISFLFLDRIGFLFQDRIGFLFLGISSLLFLGRTGYLTLLRLGFISMKKWFPIFRFNISRWLKGCFLFWFKQKSMVFVC